MTTRRPIYDRLFRGIVVMGAALGASACDDTKPLPDAGVDAKIADAAPVGDAALHDATEVDAVIIL